MSREFFPALSSSVLRQRNQIEKDEKMQTTTPTAREQFVEDYLLVIENDYEAWTTLKDYAAEAKAKAAAEEKNLLATYYLASRLKDEWENAAAAASVMIEENSEVMSLMIKQMLIGYGIDPFYDIAQRVMKSSS